MSKYPEVITEETLEINAHINNEEVEQDIVDTKADIERAKQEIEGHYLIANANPASPEGKINYFKATGKEDRVQEMQDFIEFLERLLAARKNANNNT